MCILFEVKIVLHLLYPYFFKSYENRCDNYGISGVIQI